MIRPHRSHPLWYAFLLHRLSGLGLALFLPLHLYMLSLALTDPRSEEHTSELHAALPIYHIVPTLCGMRFCCIGCPVWGWRYFCHYIYTCCRWP